MRLSLAFLLLFGWFFGTGEATKPCERPKGLFKLPIDGTECEATINWKVKDDDEALATCLEHFPTTFVKGTKTGPVGTAGLAHCTVKPSYQCVNTDHFLIYDKCYNFPKDASGKYIEDKISEYRKPMSSLDKSSKMCGGGNLSVFYSYKHAKFVGMKAHTLGIAKLWIGIDSNGYTLEEENNDKMKIISEPWKLIKGDYWTDDASGPKLKKFNEAEAKYFFMRTITDNFNNRFQGSFERADDKFKATFACEFESKFTKDQKWYCSKLPELGIASVYDAEDVRNGMKSRCLYLTGRKYAWNGTEDMLKIKGCQEQPSDLHSAGMDDGTGREEAYGTLLQHKGKVRIAGIFLTRIGEHTVHFQPKGTTIEGDGERLKQASKYRYLTHHGKMQDATASQIKWHEDYPQNELSDFSSDSSTVGLLNGKQIDLHPEVRLPAVCSLTFFQQCENLKNPCGIDTNFECMNSKEYKTDTGGTSPHEKGFFKCECPKPKMEYVAWPDAPKYKNVVIEAKYNNLPYVEADKKCNWNPSLTGYCVWMRFFTSPDSYQSAYLKLDDNHPKRQGGLTFAFAARSDKWDDNINDKLDQIIVRPGCNVSVLSHYPGYAGNWVNEDTINKMIPLLRNVTAGTYDVPNKQHNTLTGIWDNGSSSIFCDCKF